MRCACHYASPRASLASPLTSHPCVCRASSPSQFATPLTLTLTLTLTPPSLPLTSPLQDEYSPTNGIQFYGTTGDTLIVQRTGEAYFKPRGHADLLEITLNESLMITPAVLEAGAAASAASSGGRRLNAKGKPMSYDELIKDMRAGSGHPAFKDAFKGVAKVNRDEAPAGPMRRMLEEASSAIRTGGDPESHPLTRTHSAHTPHTLRTHSAHTRMASPSLLAANPPPDPLRRTSRSPCHLRSVTMRPTTAAASSASSQPS